MKRAVIMIGISGAGKSTRVRELTEGLSEEDYAIHSTDSYHFIDDEYVFQPKKLGYFHKLNQEAFADSLSKGTLLVICDNTNLTNKERKPYVEWAEAYGYEVQYEIVGEFTETFAKVCANRNAHGVPLKAILRMVNRAQLPE